MSAFFDPFPKTLYLGDIATNIMVRFRVREIVLKYTKLLDDYIIIDGEKPFVVADKYYGRPELSELILLTNTIIDPYYGWPLTDDEFEGLMIKKYGSVKNAMQLEYAFYRIVQERTVMSDGTIVPEKSLRIDKTAFLALPTDQKRMMYAYDYELELNEQKRRIYLIKKMYIPQIETELKNIFKK